VPRFTLAILLSVLSGEVEPATIGPAPIAELDWMSRLTISIGAGLYEEFLFRMIGTAIVHALVVDLLGAKERVGRAAAVVITGLAFGWYHAPESMLMMAYFTLAGVFFGWLYLARGFGITAGAHAVYDVLVLVVLAGPASGG